MLLRNALVVLALSPAGRAWSVDARIRTGRWRGDGLPAPSWPRYLLVVQLLVLYFTAGVQKVSRSWLPMGDWSALYIAMRDPAFSKLPRSWVDATYVLTQLGTLTTWLWEWSAPLLLLAYHYRDTRTRPGRLRALCNRSDLLVLWVALGAIFHLGTDFALRLGIFPFACMSLYPAFFHHDELRSGARWVRRRIPGMGGAAAATEAASSGGQQ